MMLFKLKVVILLLLLRKLLLTLLQLQQLFIFLPLFRTTRPLSKKPEHGTLLKRKIGDTSQEGPKKKSLKTPEHVKTEKVPHSTQGQSPQKPVSHADVYSNVC